MPTLPSANGESLATPAPSSPSSRLRPEQVTAQAAPWGLQELVRLLTSKQLREDFSLDSDISKGMSASASSLPSLQQPPDESTLACPAGHDGDTCTGSASSLGLQVLVSPEVSS